MGSFKEKRFKYLTDPKYSQETDLKAIEIGNNLDVNSIGKELVLRGLCLLLKIKDKVIILDPSSYTIINKKSKEA